MARFGSLPSGAISGGSEPVSAGLHSLLPAERNAYTSRTDVLLGTTPSQHLSQAVQFETAFSAHAGGADDDLVEFKEEDVWAADTGGSWFGATEVKEAQEADAEWPKGWGVKDSRLVECKDKSRGGCDENARDISIMIKAGTNTNRIRLGVDRERGLSAAFATPGPGLSSSSLSPVSWTQMPSRESTPGRLAIPPRRVPQAGLSSAFGGTKQLQHQSAPVNVPDWTKILGIGKREDGNGTVDVDEDDEEERLPPHELLDREDARSQNHTSSMCEGLGRTLKGRDLSRVRNAVLRKTGFID